MPVTRTSSLAIAVGCHRLDGGEHPKTALNLLRWGVMSKSRAKSSDQQQEQQERHSLLKEEDDHCGVSADEIEGPQVKSWYA